MQINGDGLRAIRERSGLSVKALAEAAEIQASHLSNIEANRRKASEAVIVRLAQALKVPVTAILRWPEAA